MMDGFRVLDNDPRALELDGVFPLAIEELTRLEGVSEKTKAKILRDNCAHLYKMPAGA
jgi:hypothetical protein